MNRRIGFDIPSGFHGRGDGTVVELDEILEAASRNDFSVKRIWIAPELHQGLLAAILTAPGTQGKIEVKVNLGEFRSGPILSSYRPKPGADPIPFFLDPDIRSNRIVIE